MPDDSTRLDSTTSAQESPAVGEDLRSLWYFAFERRDTAAFEQWRRLDLQRQQEALLERHVFVAVLSDAARRLDNFGAAGRGQMLDFADRIHRQLIECHLAMAARKLPFGLEWFQGLEAWATALLAQHQYARTEQTLRLAYATGAQRLAGIYQALRATEALLLATTGRHAEAAQIAVAYAMRPYLMPDRRLRPQIYRRLMAALILVGRMAEYRSLLWRGLSDVYFDGATRTWFVDQARATYRGHLRTLLRAEVPSSLKLQHALRVVGDALGRLRIARLIRADRLLDLANFALAYYLRYGRAPRRLIGAPSTDALATDRILVTRAMGGIGDLLMMTPGLRALRQAHPRALIDFAVPRGYFALFDGNDDFNVVDIEAPELDAARYGLWFDLTDCPAARIESRQMPNVRSDRVQIFAQAMGIGRGALQASGAAPRYEIAPEETQFAGEFIAQAAPAGRPVVGIQLHSAESYRDYPHVEALAADLARDHCVLLFDSQPISGFDGPHLHKVVLPLRRAFAVAACCDLLVAPDSSFVHLGAAFGKRVLAIFGPVDGAVRCRCFPTVTVVAPSAADFPCAPCWRSEFTPCRLTGLRASPCLHSIEPRVLADQVRTLLKDAR